MIPGALDFLQNYDQEIVALSSVAGALSLALAAISYRAESKARIVAQIDAIHNSIRARWVDYFKASKKYEMFYFCELVNHYEILCGLVNRGKFPSEVRRQISEHILEVLANFPGSPDARKYIAKLHSGRTTFKEIRMFVRRRFYQREDSRAIERFFEPAGAP